MEKQENKYKGISFEKNSKKQWRARARIDGKVCHVGRFSTQEEAKIARDNFLSEKSKLQDSGNLE